MPSPLVKWSILRQVCKSNYTTYWNYSYASLEIGNRQCRIVFYNYATFANFRIIIAICILDIQGNIVSARGVVANICRILLGRTYSFSTLESPCPRCWRTRRSIGKVNAVTNCNVVRRSNKCCCQFAIRIWRRNISVFINSNVCGLSFRIFICSV